MKTYKIGLVVLMTSFASCGGIEFDPNIYLPSISRQHLADRNGDIVPFTSKRMAQFGCMHQDKWKELNRILEENKIHDTVVPRILDRIQGNSE